MNEFVRAGSQRRRILRGEVIAMAPTAPVRHNAEVIECVKTSHRQRLPTSSGSPRQPAKVISAEAGNQNQRLASEFTTERTKSMWLKCIGLIDREQLGRAIRGLVGLGGVGNRAASGGAHVRSPVRTPSLLGFPWSRRDVHLAPLDEFGVEELICLCWAAAVP
jgi:hypothetical protein